MRGEFCHIRRFGGCGGPGSRLLSLQHAFALILCSALLLPTLVECIEPHTWLPIRQVESNHTTLRSIRLYGCREYRSKGIDSSTDFMGNVEIDFGISSCPQPLKSYDHAYQTSLDGSKSQIVLIQFDHGTGTEDAHTWSFQLEYTHGVHLYDVIYPRDGMEVVEDFARNDEGHQKRHANQHSLGLLGLFSEFWGGHHDENNDDITGAQELPKVEDPPPLMIPPYGKPKYLLGRCRSPDGLCPNFKVTVASLSDQSAATSTTEPCKTVGYALLSDILPTRGMPTAPNYFAASRSRSFDEVTLCTQLTTDRMYKLRHLASNYHGPISAAIFIRDHGMDVPYVVKFMLSYPELNARVDVHLVFDDGRTPFKVPRELPEGNSRLAYPINYMRNVAILQARTRWILLVEGDMTMPPGSYARMQRHITEGHFNTGESGGGGKPTGYIVPLFYPTDSFRKTDPIPKDKTELYKSHMFQYCPYDSHRFLLMQLNEWYSADMDAAPTYIDAYGGEPYFVAEREMLPMFDENYYCQGDKLQQVDQCRECAGFQFKLLPDLFLINIEHFDKDEAREDRVGPKPQLCTWYLHSRHADEGMSQSRSHRQWAFGLPTGVNDASSSLSVSKRAAVEAGGSLSCPPPEPCPPSIAPLLFIWNVIFVLVIVYLWYTDNGRTKPTKRKGRKQHIRTSRVSDTLAKVC